MKNWLKDKCVILSGASGGIGRELTKILVRKYGARVMGIGRSEEKMLSLKTELAENTDKFSYHIFDVSDAAAWQSFAESLREKGVAPILLINNAGVFPKFGKTLQTETEAFERVVKINYLSVVYAVKAIAPLLAGEGKEKAGIVNIASSAALCSLAGTAAYTASKSALKGYTEVLQAEEKGRICVGIVYPGTTATELFRDDDNTKNSALDKIAMPAEKMAKKIARKILRRKKRAVLGWDAKLMNFTAKLMPVKGPALICRVMRASKSKVFTEVFDYKK